jgi:hypothetical protein
MPKTYAIEVRVKLLLDAESAERGLEIAEAMLKATPWVQDYHWQSLREVYDEKANCGNRDGDFVSAQPRV